MSLTRDEAMRLLTCPTFVSVAMDPRLKPAERTALRGVLVSAAEMLSRSPSQLSAQAGDGSLQSIEAIGDAIDGDESAMARLEQLEHFVCRLHDFVELALERIQLGANGLDVVAGHGSASGDAVVDQVPAGGETPVGAPSSAASAVQVHGESETRVVGGG